jgi:hypothetical protein
VRNLDKQKIETPVRKFKNFIEMNKDHQAYSDFKEGVNKGLDIAKYTFEENAEKFSLSYLDEDRDIRIKSLQSDFNQLLDRIALSKKPNFSEDCLDGIRIGFERSKEIFREFIENSFPLESS